MTCPVCCHQGLLHLTLCLPCACLCPCCAGTVGDVTLPRKILDVSTTGRQPSVLGLLSPRRGCRRKEAWLLLFLGSFHFAQKFPHRAKLLSVLDLSTFLHEKEKNNISEQGHVSSTLHVSVEHRAPDGETNREIFTYKVTFEIVSLVRLPYPKVSCIYFFLKRLM